MQPSLGLNLNLNLSLDLSLYLDEPDRLSGIRNYPRMAGGAAFLDPCS